MFTYDPLYWPKAKRASRALFSDVVPHNLGDFRVVLGKLDLRSKRICCQTDSNNITETMLKLNRQRVEKISRKSLKETEIVQQRFVFFVFVCLFVCLFVCFFFFLHS